MKLIIDDSILDVKQKSPKHLKWEIYYSDDLKVQQIENRVIITEGSQILLEMILFDENMAKFYYDEYISCIKDKWNLKYSHAEFREPPDPAKLAETDGLADLVEKGLLE